MSVERSGGGAAVGVDDDETHASFSLTSSTVNKWESWRPRRRWSCTARRASAAAAAAAVLAVVVLSFYGAWGDYDGLPASFFSSAATREKK
ncbi:hypothetical protein ABZP36_032446 [Zizania latifolia]